jgi:type I restriction enzyme R subunit
MNEEETKLNLITPMLQKVGWGSVESSVIRMEYPISKGRLIGGGRRTRPDSADYVLQYKGQNLAIIEAKAVDKYYTDGVAQTKSYANRLQVRFCYATNGKEIYAIDNKTGKESDVFNYPSPDELWQMTYATSNRWRDRFASIPFEDRGGLWEMRYYQTNAVNNVLDAVANNSKRILLTLATGTGKTAIAFQIAWKLFHSKWNLQQNALRSPRILFLADRNILADQAFNKFNAFEEESLIRIKPQEINKKGVVPTHGSMYFTIFQSFMTEDKGSEHIEFRFGQYPADFFDFIIIDECHRGGANDESSWRGILDYFSPAVQLGLTATPKRQINANTYEYFGEPVYTYSLKDGINDGFLTPFRVMQISSNVDDYIYDDNDIILSGEVESGDEFSESDFNRKIIIKDREVARVKKFLDVISQSDKTLVFCKSQRHAALIRDLVNQHSNSTHSGYCQRVTADDGELGEQALRDFQDDEKNIPTILTTSQKLSTGVDAPQIKNIVLLRPINSMIEFKQIIGRGTRLFKGKDYFTIIDFVKAHTKFQDSEWDGEQLEVEQNICPKCNTNPCRCEKSEPKPCEICGFSPCQCEKIPPEMIEVKLTNGSSRVLHNITTTFYDADGNQVDVKEFLTTLFGKLPNFFKSEEKLREIWASPNTREKLLNELKTLGYGIGELKGLQQAIQADNSDVFDVLSFIAFDNKPVSRKLRIQNTQHYLNTIATNQQEFINFVLSQYQNNGFEELSLDNLPRLLEVKYNSISDANALLGGLDNVKNTFIELQRCLYEKQAS